MRNIYKEFEKEKVEKILDLANCEYLRENGFCEHKFCNKIIDDVVEGRENHRELINHFLHAEITGGHINVNQTWDEFGCHIDCSCGKHFDVPYHEIEPSLAHECTCPACKSKRLEKPLVK